MIIIINDDKMKMRKTSYEFQEKMNKLYQASDTLHLPYLEGMDTAEMAFRLTDTNKDGYVDKSEFKKMAKSLSKEKIEKAFEYCDKNKDGKLDMNEFKEMMKPKSPRKIEKKLKRQKSCEEKLK